MDNIADLVCRPDDELRALIAELEEREREVSRERRILHGQLDILRSELIMRLQRKRTDGQAVIKGNDIDTLSQILAGKLPKEDTPEEPSQAEDQDQGQEES